MKKLGIALGSGGAKGIAHIAYLEALEELHITPKIISGASMGSIIGSLYAAGLKAADLVELVSDINTHEILNMLDPLAFNGSALLGGGKIEAFLKKTLPVDDFAQLPIPLKVIASDFWTREQIVFDSGEIVPAVRASMSIPGIFEPMSLKGRILVDGGVVNPVPFDIIRNQCDVLVAIDVNIQRKPDPGSSLIPRPVEAAFQAINGYQQTIVRQKTQLCPPNVYANPGLVNVEMLNFAKVKEILEYARSKKDAFKKQVTKAMQSLLPYYCPLGELA